MSHEEFKKLETPDGVYLEACPVCAASAEIWRRSDSPSSPTETAVCCSNSDVIGPQAGEVNTGCLLFMPPDDFYRPTVRDAVKFWNEYAKALGAQQRARRWAMAKALRSGDAVPATSAGEFDASKGIYWFDCLAKCARLLGLADDEPIPSGVVAAVERLIAGTTAAVGVAGLAHGHRDDYYLMANCRALLSTRRTKMPNWSLAADLFATGSNSARQICHDARIDPDGYRVERADRAAAKDADGQGGTS